MKKMLKVLAAFAMIAMAISFAGCDMATEDELLEDPKKTTTGGTGGGGNSGGGGGSGSSSLLWSSFDGASMQVWKGEYSGLLTADLDETDEGLEITIKDEGWWGMCFCNDAAVGAESDPVTFDMSKVAKISFEAKASKNGSMWVAQSPKNSKPANTKSINLTTSFETKTYTLSNPGTDCYGVLDLGGDPNLGNTVESDVVITIKNIKFLDANGAETTPSRNE